MGALRQDLRYALRTLTRSPGFTAVAVATLALGIGANAAVFSIVRGVLLTPLPYRDAGRLLVGNASLPDYEDIRRETRSLDETAVFATNLYNVGLERGEGTEQRRGAEVSGEFFRLFGAAAAGRVIGPADAREPVAVLASAFARQRYGSDRAALDQTLSLGGRPFTIVGVMPPGFEFPSRQFDFWVPLEHEMARTPAMAENRGLRIFRVVAHVRPGVSLQAARAEVAEVSRRLQKIHPDTNAGFTAQFVPLKQRLLGEVRPALWTLFAAVGLVLLIASANVANLLLARGAARSREIAIRSALGARRGRLIRQLLTESVLLSLAGATLGVLLAAWAISALPAVAPSDLPRLSEVRLEVPVLLFALGAAVASGLLFGTAPAFQASRTDLARAVADSARGSSGRQSRLRGALVVAEVALAVVVLVGAGLLARSLQRLLHVEKGFRPQNVTSFSVNVVDLDGREARAAATLEIVRGIRELPGVVAAGAGTALPPQTAQRATRFEIEGRVASASEDSSAYFIAATPGYFDALGTRVFEGRAFGDGDRADTAPVALVSRGLARRLFPGASAVGRRLRLLNPEESSDFREIVGVVEDVRYSGLDDPGDSAIYTPFSQTPFPWAYAMIRSTTPAETLAPAVASLVRRVHPALVAANVRPLETFVSESVAGPRFQAALLSSFAGLALLLAALGLYGLVSYSATLRRREIGIRIALGARPGQILGLVTAGGLRLVVVGLAIGCAAALGVTRLLSSLLFEVRPTDPTTYAAIAALLLAVGILAGAIPARRAARIDPLDALRSE
jgi:putative ABC transport system permease protein